MAKAKKLSKKVVAKKKVKKPVARLSKEEYNKALQHPKWQKKRLKVFERDGWKCRNCGDTETMLHVHHITYTKKYPWNELMRNLKSLCDRCHKKEHKIK